MKNLLTGLECLNTFAVPVQHRIIENVNLWAGPDAVVRWLMDDDYEDPKEFLGTCVNFHIEPEKRAFWEGVYLLS